MNLSTIQRGNAITARALSEATVSTMKANVKLSSLYKDSRASDAGRDVYTKRLISCSWRTDLVAWINI